MQALSIEDARPELAGGCILGGRYRVDRKIGAGGMGEVWTAKPLGARAKVAVKLPLARAVRMPEVAARFEREAILLGRMHGDHFPRAIDFLVDDAYGPVLVTELLRGASLARVLAGIVPVARAVDLGIELASGVAELHGAGVVHRDLKPGNVIVRRLPDGSPRAVIIDLGVARLLDEAADPRDQWAELTARETLVGTVEYMAPEQILDPAGVNGAADLYALGALLYRAVSGVHVFGDELDRAELVRAKLTCAALPLPVDRGDPVAVGLAAVLARALERCPARRYPSAEALRDDLLRLRRSSLATWRSVSPSSISPHAIANRSQSGRRARPARRSLGGACRKADDKETPMAEMINSARTVSVLNDLIQLDFDAIAAYKAAIDRLHDDSDKAQLAKFMADHQRHVRDLTPLVADYGGIAATEADFKKILTKGKVVIAALVGDRAILEAMKSNEDAMNDAYENATRDTAITSSVRVVLERNLSDERRHRAWIERRVASMTTSSGVESRPFRR